jgi:tRNA threonylcarbamoyladenosine biosynthesis protein TsaB
MTILGLETSTPVCSVGLFRDGNPGLEQSLRESHIHSEKLLTLVQDVVRSGGITVDRLDAIAISIGPGSFTGLRIGLSTAKGLSYALDKPLVAVSTFEAMAEAGRQRHQSSELITVVIDAKKDEWYVGQFQVVNGRMTETGPVGVRSLDDVMLLLRADRPSLVLTDNVEGIRRSIDAHVVIEDVRFCCRGDVVASLGHAKVLKQEFSDASALEPMYLKDFVVRTAAPVS